MLCLQFFYFFKKIINVFCTFDFPKYFKNAKKIFFLKFHFKIISKKFEIPLRIKKKFKNQRKKWGYIEISTVKSSEPNQIVFYWHLFISLFNSFLLKIKIHESTNVFYSNYVKFNPRCISALYPWLRWNSPFVHICICVCVSFLVIIIPYISFRTFLRHIY